MKINNIGKYALLAPNEVGNESKGNLENEFQTIVLPRLINYLVSVLKCSKNDLYLLVNVMSDSYLAHRLNGIPMFDWFLKVKHDVSKFAKLRELQIEHNNLIEKKRGVLEKLGSDVSSIDSQKVDVFNSTELLIERLQTDCESANLSRNYQEYNEKISKLNDTIVSFKLNCAELENKLNSSQGNLRNFQVENAKLKEKIIASQNKNLLMKNRFNDVIDRFAAQNRSIKAGAEEREKKFISTINDLGKQIEYWKNKHPKSLLQKFTAEFNKKVQVISSQFENQISELNKFYAEKIGSLKKKDQILFSKYNSIIDSYEQEKSKFLRMLDAKNATLERVKKRSSERVVNVRSRLERQLKNEKSKLKLLKEKYEEKYKNKINRLNSVNEKKMKKLRVQKAEISLNRQIRPSSTAAIANKSLKLTKTLINDLVAKSEENSPQLTRILSKENKFSEIVRSNKKRSKKNANDIFEKKGNKVNVNSEKKHSLFDIIGKTNYDLQYDENLGQRNDDEGLIDELKSYLSAKKIRSKNK